MRCTLRKLRTLLCLFKGRYFFKVRCIYETERLLRFEGSFLNLVLYVCIVLEIDISIFFRYCIVFFDLGT